MLPQARFNAENARRNLLRLFKVETLDAFGSFGRAEITAAGVLMDYVETTQKGQMPRVEKPVKIYEQKVMEIDGATRRSLELLESSSGDKTVRCWRCLTVPLPAPGHGCWPVALPVRWSIPPKSPNV